MFLTRIVATVTGYTAREAIEKMAPDGKKIAEITLGVGGGSVEYPVRYVTVPVWEQLADEALEAIQSKGIGVEARGMLRVREYIGKGGVSGVAVELKAVRELKIYDRDGELIKVLSGEKAE